MKCRLAYDNHCAGEAVSGQDYCEYCQSLMDDDLDLRQDRSGFIGSCSEEWVPPAVLREIAPGVYVE